MVEQQARGWWVIAASFLLALLLSVAAMPEFLPVEMGYLRPQWVLLVLVYWVIALPHRVGIVTAWVLGLALDVLLGSLLGQHGLALVIVAYIAASLYQRLRMFAVWQQSLVLFAMVGLHQLINYWIESIADLSEWTMWLLFPAVVSALLWPWIFGLLRFLRRFYQVS